MVPAYPTDQVELCALAAYAATPTPAEYFKSAFCFLQVCIAGYGATLPCLEGDLKGLVHTIFPRLRSDRFLSRGRVGGQNVCLLTSTVRPVEVYGSERGKCFRLVYVPSLSRLRVVVPTFCVKHGSFQPGNAFTITVGFFLSANILLGAIALGLSHSPEKAPAALLLTTGLGQRYLGSLQNFTSYPQNAGDKAS